MTGLRDLAAAVAAAAVACGLSAGCSHMASPATRSPETSAPASAAAEMAAYLRGLAAAGRFSGTALVARDGRVLLDAGYGLADRSADVRNGPGPIFQVGSVTKQFTAMAIAILAGQKLITGTPRLVPRALLAQMLTVHAPCPYHACPLPADRGYGCGWFTGGTGADQLVNHSGSVDGFWAYNGFYPPVTRSWSSNLDTTAINPISAQLNHLATTAD